MEATVPCIKNLNINAFLGAGKAMTPRRVKYPEIAKISVPSFKTAARATTTI